MANISLLMRDIDTADPAGDPQPRDSDEFGSVAALFGRF
jgi:hypothetical protein